MFVLSKPNQIFYNEINYVAFCLMSKSYTLFCPVMIKNIFFYLLTSVVVAA